jgi:hypothetical protein
MVPLPTSPPSGVGTREGGAVGVRPLGFNCPSCGVVLTVVNPRNYDGQPAPCPHCAVVVVPPRIFRAGEVGLPPIELHPLPGLSGRFGERVKMPRAVYRPRRGQGMAGDWDGYNSDGMVLAAEP